MKGDLCVLGLPGIGEIVPGDDLAGLLVEALQARKFKPGTGDVLVVTQKAVSKAEGRVVDLRTVRPSTFALSVAREFNKDPALVQVVLDETSRVVRMSRGVMIMQTRHGFVCANAGVDRSNAATHQAVLLPEDPDASARAIRARLRDAFGAAPAVIISDTFGRPWRMGQTNVAIGLAGMSPFIDYRGRYDRHGNELVVTQIAAVDELAGAAELVMQKTIGVPAVLVRGFEYQPGDATARELVRAADRDLFQ